MFKFNKRNICLFAAKQVITIVLYQWHPLNNWKIFLESVTWKNIQFSVFHIKDKLINMFFFFCTKGYISQTKKLGAVGLPSYRSFSLEEIEAATNYFDTASLMGEDSYGKVWHNVSNYFCIYRNISFELYSYKNSGLTSFHWLWYTSQHHKHHLTMQSWFT